MIEATTAGRDGRLKRGVAWAMRRLRSAGTRFPVVVVLVIAFSVVSNAATRERFADGTLLLRLLSAIGVAAALSTAVTLAAERRLGTALSRFVLPALAAASGAGAIWFSHPFALHGPILTLVAVLAIPLVGSAGRGGPREFWTFTLWSLVGAALGFLSVLLFVTGAYAVLEMTRYLFRVALLRRFDEHLWTTALTLVGPLFALGRIPATDRAALAFDPAERLVRAVRPLFEWVLAPLVLAAGAVLHLYIARIVATGEVPAGQIGWIVSVYLLFLLGLRLAIDPFHAGGGTSPASIFRRVWAAIMIAPLLLLAHAMRLRIASEGITVDRYYLLLWLVAAALIVLAQVPRRLRGDIRVVAAVPIVLLLASLIGPLGVADTVARSQTARIDRAFGGILADTRSGRPAVSPGQAGALLSRLRALERVGALENVAALLPEARRGDPFWREPDLTAAGVLAVLVDGQPASGRRSFGSMTSAPFDIGGFDRAASSVRVTSPDHRPSTGIRLALYGNRLGVLIDGVGDEVDLAPFLEGLPWTERSTGPARTIDVATRAGRSLRLRVEAGSMDAKGILEDFAATVLWRASEWRPAAGATPPR